MRIIVDKKKSVALIAILIVILFWSRYYFMHNKG